MILSLFHYAGREQSGTKMYLSTRKVRSETLVPYMFIAPALTILTVFLIVPVCMAAWYSLNYFNMLKPNQIHFIGLNNYKRLFQDRLFYVSVKNTFYFAVVLVPLQVFFSFVLALLVNQKWKAIAISRIAFFSPMLTSMTVVSILWTFIYNPTPGQGLLNTFLVKVGAEPNPFLFSAKTAMNSIIGMTLWQGVGNYMMIYLAGLQGMPPELYEAASLDGANWLQKLMHITLPGLKNVSVFIILMTSIGAMKMFTQSYMMTQGGPDESTRTIVYYIYQQGLQFRNIGYASSASVIFFFIVLCLSTAIKRMVNEE